jgi:hypothetical protein
MHKPKENLNEALECAEQIQEIFEGKTVNVFVNALAICIKRICSKHDVGDDVILEAFLGKTDTLRIETRRSVH